MVIESSIPILFPLKESELPVLAISVEGTIQVVEAIVEGTSVSFSRDASGHFKRDNHTHPEPAYIAYIERQLFRKFN